MRFSRALRAVLALVCASAIALTAAGCAPADPKPTKTPTPTKTAIFASEEEALQAAVDVYQQFNAAFDQVTAEGEAAEDELSEVVTDEYFTEQTSEESFADRGWHTEGSSSFRNAELASLNQDGKSAKVQIALCRDVSNQRIIDENGNDVTDENRTSALIPLSVTMIWDDESSALLISETGLWDESQVC
ncbi:hypothetical protein [Microbacterium sp. MPKO10]|uniref:hypothetical protein n=1 Tax=Microbacterium sp. MPKO10 TaxID=2989818 RepID=UPI002236C119|nr:hypothetical protein [Microbacterium sp. MPKO10]MCW4458921.1 hypothetical protein [Microbacterium sp. MPKO10]